MKTPDFVGTVPKGEWPTWLSEGALPGEEAGHLRFHFWCKSLPSGIRDGSRLYIVAHGRLRGYSPIIGWERECRLRPDRACLIRADGAVAVTIPERITGFRGIRRRWWPREEEVPFPEWATEGVR